MKTIKHMCVLFSGLVLFAGVAVAGGDVAAGKAKAASCAGCHGAKGEGMGPNPPLTGLDAAFLVKQMEDFKSGARPTAMMKMFVQSLSKQDMENIAAYYASLKK